MLPLGGGEELCVKHRLALLFPPDYTAQGSSRPKKKRCSLPCRTAPGTATGGIALHSCKPFLFHLTSPADGLATLHAFPSLHCNSSHQKYVFQTFNLWLLSKIWPNQQDLRGWFERSTLYSPSCRNQTFHSQMPVVWVLEPGPGHSWVRAQNQCWAPVLQTVFIIGFISPYAWLSSVPCLHSCAISHSKSPQPGDSAW